MYHKPYNKSYKPKAYDNYERIRNYCLWLLGRRNYGVLELNDRLKLKKADPIISKQVLKELKEANYLNDNTTIQFYIESVKDYKNYGYYFLQNKLRQKKFTDLQITEALEIYYPINDELEVAKKYLEKFLKKNLDKQKLYTKLAAKGFRSDVINRALSSRLTDSK